MKTALETGPPIEAVTDGDPILRARQMRDSKDVINAVTRLTVPESLSSHIQKRTATGMNPAQALAAASPSPRHTLTLCASAG